MNPPTNGTIEFPVDSQGSPRAPQSQTHPMYWSIRRELWENRSIYLAPLIVAAVVLFATCLSTITLPRRMRGLEPAKQRAAVITPYSMAPAPVMLVTFLVGMFYCLEALHGERRDRSILFWKSLPVSDLTTVLSKASIPVVMLPLIAFVLGAATQLIVLLVTIVVLLGSGVNLGALWGDLLYFPEPLVMIYGLTVHVLWFAPIYGWFLLISAWAKRAPFLWAVLPLFATMAVEAMAFRTHHFGSMLQYRLAGAMAEAFAAKGGNPIIRLSHLTPVNFLTTPGLWVGLAFAAACFAGAVRLRRNREPI